jgi:hypothetical protein
MAAISSLGGPVDGRETPTVQRTTALERLRARLVRARGDEEGSNYSRFEPARRRGARLLNEEEEEDDDRRWSVACWLVCVLLLTNAVTLALWMTRLPVPYLEPFLQAHGIARPC